MHDRLIKQLAQDQLIYGTSAYIIVDRKWWNPLYYIFGRVKTKRIHPKNLFVKKNKPNKNR